MNRVILGALVGAVPEVLIDGVITHHQVNPGGEESGLAESGVDAGDLFHQAQSHALEKSDVLGPWSGGILSHC